MGTTTLSVLVSPAIFFLVLLIVMITQGLPAARAQWRKSVGLGVGLVILFWIGLIIYSSVQIIYKDHLSLKELAKSRLEIIQGKDGNGGLNAEIANFQIEAEKLKSDDAQIVALKDKLAETEKTKPREVVRYIPSSSITVNSFQRHVSDTQRELLIANLKPLIQELKPVEIYQDGWVHEISRYASEFSAIFDEIGLGNPDGKTGSIIGSSESTDDAGISVGVIDPNNPPNTAKKFLRAVESSGFQTHYIKVDDWMINGPGTKGNGSFVLFVGVPQ